MPKSNHRKGHKQKINQYRRELKERSNRRDRIIREIQEKMKAMPASVGEMLSIEEAKPETLTLEAVAQNGPAIEVAPHDENGITEVEFEEVQ